VTPAVVEAQAAPERSAATEPAQVAARLLDAPVPSELREMATGRTFRNALWPLRGGEVRRGFRSAARGVELSAPRGTAVRAASDGLVAYAGPLRGLGDVVVLVHSNGWVSLYARLGPPTWRSASPSAAASGSASWAGAPCTTASSSTVKR
jgi:septal ring factor EnvC (AmiA/AmiB activator)